MQRPDEANAPLPVLERARAALSRFPSPSAEGMERREAPGRCATAPLWGAGALRRTPRAALQGRACETHPEARAGGDLEACEASPPNRCASRRSTPQASVRSLRRQQRTALSAARSRLAAKRLMMALRRD